MREEGRQRRRKGEGDSIIHREGVQKSNQLKPPQKH